MWADSREALTDLDLLRRRRVLDVGCGTGEFTRVLWEETDGEVIACDADLTLLGAAAAHVGGGTEDDSRLSLVLGDALHLPVGTDTVDLVVCQALLINLLDPAAALSEFARVSSDLVAVIEPDNAAVTVDSTVEYESTLEARARAAYLAGVETDASLGAVPEQFREAGLDVISTRRYDHVRIVQPPYSQTSLADARRKATGAGLADDRATMLSGDLTKETYDRLRTEWRAMGRDVVAAMRAGNYRRTETVPFYVTVGRVVADTAPTTTDQRNSSRR